MITEKKFCESMGRIMAVRDASLYLNSMLDTSKVTALDYLVPTVCELLAVGMGMDARVYGDIIRDYVYQNEFTVVVNKKRYTIMSHKHLYDLLLEMKKEDEGIA